jgi:hypothetical protein
MSAPSSMGRTAILIVILAAGLSAFASDAPTGAAHPHRKALAARTRHGAQAKSPSAAHKTAPKSTSVRRRTPGKPGSSRLSSPHSAHPSSRNPSRAQFNETTAREAQSTPHARIAVERVSISHHRGVTAGELHQARELEAEREKHEAQPAEQPAPNAEEAKSTVDEANSAPGDAKSEVVAAPVQASATPETAPTEADSTANAPASAESAEAPAPQADEPRVTTESASLTLPRGVMPPPLRGSHELLERQDDR